MPGIGVDRFADPVVVDVTGNCQASNQVHTVVLLLPRIPISATRWWVGRVDVSTSPEHVGPGVVPLHIGRRYGTHTEHPLVPGRVSGEKLEGRTGCVLTLDSAIEHGKVVRRVI